MPKILLLAIKILVVLSCFLYGDIYAQKTHYELAEKKIEEDTKTIKKLRKRNAELDSTIKELQSNLYQNRRTNEAKLKSTLNELYANSAIVKRKESELNFLRDNLQQLSQESNQLKGQVSELQNRNNRQRNRIGELEQMNSSLRQAIYKLDAELAEANAENQRIENNLVESLGKIGKLNLVIRAKERAIKDLILKYERKRNYYGFNMGFGADYSGVGGSFFSRWGRLQGVGLHAGVGYVPLPDLLYQTTGWYTNIGCNFFFYKDFYIDTTFHYPFKYVSGYKYDNALTFSLGCNWFPDFTRPFGAKIAIGDLYTNTEQFGVEHSPIITLGLTTKFSH